MSKNISLTVSIPFFIFFMSSCGQLAKQNEPCVVVEETIKHETINQEEKLVNLHKLPELPETLSFAGEKIPLDREDVRDKLMKELVIQVNFHSRTLLMLSTLGKWEDVIRKELVKNGMSEDFLFLAIAESELNNEITSNRGAAGMWQFMPESAKEHGLIINTTVDQRRDPFLATRAASEYLKESKEMFGSWVNAMASYNRGRRGFSNALKGQKQKEYFDLFLNQETSRYVYRILAMKLVYSDPQKYGFDQNAKKEKDSFVYKSEVLSSGDYDVIELATKFGVSYRLLKEFNPWLRDTKHYRLKLKKKIIFRLPK